MSRSPLEFLRIPLLVVGLTAALVACGDDAKGGDSGVDIITDSGPADAPPGPECEMTECGDLCVDTATDPLHCGGCDMACKSPGQICTGSLPCACPSPFLPSTVSPSGFDQVIEQMGIKIGLAPQIGSVFNLFAVIYDPEDDLNVPYDLANASSTLTPPAVAAGYDVDIMTMNAHTAYAPTAGTLTLTAACEDGVVGFIEDVTFSEIKDVFDPTPVPNGCSFMVEDLSFQIGSDCMDMDGGVDPADAAI